MSRGSRVPGHRTGTARAWGHSVNELEDEGLTLLELTDRLLHRGVVLTGEATISVAGVDLIYLGLNLVLSAVETMEQHKRRPA